MQNNVLDYLNNIVKQKPAKTAYSDGRSALSFQEVYDLSRSIGSFLHKKGIYKKPVVVFMRKAPREVAAFFGVVAGGDFYVPLDEEMPAGRIQLILDNVRPPLIICDRETEEIARTFCNDDGEIAVFDEMARCDIDDEALEEIHR